MKRPFDDPFSALEPVLKAHPPGGQAAAVVVDVHCEATSEKMALGHFCDSRATLAIGTHTHVPTADAMILPVGLDNMDQVFPSLKKFRRAKITVKIGKPCCSVKHLDTVSFKKFANIVRELFNHLFFACHHCRQIQT